MKKSITWKRTLRTPSSERFLALENHREVAAIDLHYLHDGTVSGTVILLEEARWTDEEIPDLLRSLDEDFLPEVDLSKGNLTYTVVMGHIVGNYQAHNEGADSNR